MSGTVRVSKLDGYVRITLDRPPLNILTNAGLATLADAFFEAGEDPATRLIRLDANGKAFCAGVDVGDHLGDKVHTMMRELARLFDTIDGLEQPTVATVRGVCLGGGCELIAAMDLCYAGETATFGQPEIRLGLFAPPASVLLPRLIGERRALELLLSGAAISANRAAEIGLVNRVIPDDLLDEEVDALCGTLLAHSGVALRQAKKAVQLARGSSRVDAHRKVHRLYMDELMQTKDAHEGLSAFLEKRSAAWRHE